MVGNLWWLCCTISEPQGRNCLALRKLLELEPGTKIRTTMTAKFSVMFVLFAQATIAKYQRLSGLNSRNLFLSVLEAEKSRSWYQPFRFLVRSPFLPCRQVPSPCAYTAFPQCMDLKGESNLSLSSSFCKTINPIKQDSTLMVSQNSITC